MFANLTKKFTEIIYAGRYGITYGKEYLHVIKEIETSLISRYRSINKVSNRGMVIPLSYKYSQHKPSFKNNKN